MTGSRSVPGLAVSAISTGTTTVTISTLPITAFAQRYYVLACSDDGGVAIEINETNNCRASATRVSTGGVTTLAIVP